MGNDVMEAARIVLDRMKFDAEYVPCDIGWKYWCTEGNALPDRTVKALKDTTCALFGAITSKAQDKAKEELSPELRTKAFRISRQSSGCDSYSICTPTCDRAKVIRATR